MIEAGLELAWLSPDSRTAYNDRSKEFEVS